MLLILRARIARGAAAKAPTAARVVHENARPGEHWLVYCDDINQLELVRAEIAHFGIASMPYYADMASDRPATLDRFSREGGVLVSIKCLDEGVDIPVVSHALIVASSRNPREFIQRRGRVLRTHPGKSFAVVHDLVVEPPDPASDDFRSLVLGELARAHEFATHALNPSAALAIQALAIDWDLDPDELFSTGFEEDVDSSDDV
jgi:superfamily II DNA or RNA helicase